MSAFVASEYFREMSLSRRPDGVSVLIKVNIRLTSSKRIKKFSISISMYLGQWDVSLDTI